MKAYKKISCILLALGMCLCTTPVFAQNNNTEATVPVDNETLKVQLESAIEQGEQPVSTASLQNEETGLTYDVDVYEIPLDENKNYTSSENFESVCYVASTDHMTLDQSTVPATTRGDGSHSDSSWDSSGSAYFTLGFDFDRNYNGYIQLTYIWGNATFYDGVGLVSSRAGANQECPSVGVHENNWWNVGSSFGIHTGFGSWVPDTTSSTFGAAWQSTLNRYGSTWNFSLPVYRYL